MNRRLDVREEAELDIIGAVMWYEDQRCGLGGEFLNQLDVVMQRLVQTPLQLPEIKYEVGRALLKKFPSSVYFRADDDLIDVIAVVHHHRNPATWQRRT